MDSKKKISELLKKDDLLLANKYGVLPDPDFNPARNKMVIERSIARAERERAQKVKMWDETMRERAEAIASFLKHVDNGKNNNVETYFGRQKLAQLRGEDILTQLKGSILNKNGKA